MLYGRPTLKSVLLSVAGVGLMLLLPQPGMAALNHPAPAGEYGSACYQLTYPLQGRGVKPEIPAANGFKDTVPHQLITKPYIVCDHLDELTARINSLYRKPFRKLIDKKTGVMQPEVIYFKDITTGHEVVSLTRGLCIDIASPDLGRPAWTCNGQYVMILGNRAYYKPNGKLVKVYWPGQNYVMNGDYSNERNLRVRYEPPFTEDGRTVSETAGILGKFNIMDPKYPNLCYYAVGNKLWQVTLNDHGPNIAKLLCTFPNSRRKIIQQISPQRQLLIQDVNAHLDKSGKPAYMPLIYVVNLDKKPGTPGFLYSHTMDYNLPTIKSTKGKIIHDAKNDYRVHSLQFGGKPDTIGWNYGSMVDVGEYISYYLDISHGMEGQPTHHKISGNAQANYWGQYESHGWTLGHSDNVVYFGGRPRHDGKQPATGGPFGWGAYIHDFSKPQSIPRFLITSPGGHVAGGNCLNPNVWAIYVSEAWNTVKDSDGLVWGRVTGPAKLLCYTYSRARGNIQYRHHKPVSWNGIDAKGARPYGSIPRPVLSPDGTKCWFHSSMLMPSEHYVGSYVVVIARPEPPVHLALSNDGSRVKLTWEPAAMSHETKGYHIYRGDADGKHFEELTKAAIPQMTFTDATAESGQTYTYAVTAEEWSTLESDKTSNVLRVAVGADGVQATSLPGVEKWDATAPPAVTDFTVTREPDARGQYRLSWNKNAATDLRHYNIYFSTQGKPDINQKCLIDSPLSNMTGYLDWSAPIGTDVYYAITAVDRQGNESKPVYIQLK